MSYSNIEDDGAVTREKINSLRNSLLSINHIVSAEPYQEQTRDGKQSWVRYEIRVDVDSVKGMDDSRNWDEIVYQDIMTTLIPRSMDSYSYDYWFTHQDAQQILHFCTFGNNPNAREYTLNKSRLGV